MSLAETQQLAVELNLTGNLRSAVPQAEAQLSGLNRVGSVAQQGAGLLSRGFGAVGTAAGKVGSALSHAKNQLLGLVTGPLGMLGLGAGLFSIGGLFKSGADKAREFGGEVKRLAAITGLSVEVTSRLAGAFDHFGLSAETVAKVAGMAEKNLGLLTQTTTKGGASSEALTKAQERLRVAQLKLVEVEGKRNHTASQLVAAQNRVADATRALNKLEADHGVTVSNATEFQKKFGLALVDTNGHVKDFNTLLLDSADFWNNKTIPAQTKALALSKLYGRSWQDLIPVLGAGRTGIKAAEEEAARLGLTITKDNIEALSKAKEATRTWTDALGGLKLQIGLAVMPTLTNLTKGLTSLVVDNRDRIVAFIKGIADGGQKLASAFGTYVIPALKNVGTIIGTMFSAAGGVSFVGILEESANFAKDLGAVLNDFVAPAIKGIVGAWNGLPDPLRQLLIKGFIANKVVKWTFGFDAVGFGLQMAQSFIGNVVGKITGSLVGSLASAGIGKAFVQPVFVTNPGFGLPGGGAAGGAAGAAEGGIAATIKSGLRWVPGVGLVLVAGEAVNQLPGVQGGMDIFNRNVDAAKQGNLIGDAVYGTIKNALKAAGANSQFNTSPGFNDQSPAMVNAFNQMAGLIRSGKERPDGVLATKLVAARVDALTAIFRVDLARLIGATKDNDIRKVAGKITAELVKGRQGDPTLVSTQNRLSELKDAVKAMQTKKLHTHDPETARILGNDIAKLNRKIADRELVLRQFQKEQAILASSESTSRKLTDLTAIQRYLKNTGHPHAAATVAKAIADMKARLAQTTARAGEVAAAAVRHKKQLVDVNVSNTVHVTTNVSARQIRTAEVVVKRYGNTSVGWT